VSEDRSIKSALLSGATLFFLSLALLLSLEEAVSAKISVIPLPAVAFSRNEGPTSGALSALLFINESGIYRILTPILTYNRIIGPSLSITWLEYLGEGKDFGLYAYQAVGIDQEFSLTYRNFTLREGKLGIDLQAGHFKDSTYRFFGLTPLSSSQNETNFTQTEIGYLVSLRVQPSRSYAISFSQRVRSVDVGTGRVERLPFLRDRFPDLPGGFGSTILGHRLSFTYDTRDIDYTPSTGALVTLYTEIDRNFETGNDRYYTGSRLDARFYFSSSDGRFSTAVRGAFFITGGHQIPFYEQAMLGGQNTLRDFGKNRFIDDGLILFNIEERIRIFSRPMFGVIPEFELAPFLDVGQVFSSLRKNLGDRLQVNPGVGFRGIVRPNVVGRLDLGFGREGTTIYVGIDFPF
jgi:outer membrane protein assembly factor BamA